ncbi:CzcE family metal-binding protein [Duganella hordei]|uniref:CzcE family metal-binding protein n=1 Tax=Duganella hordei TaxID=2865934 RepID=UPI0030E8A3F6
MFNAIRIASLTAALTATLAASTAFAANGTAEYGSAVAPSNAQRHIVINASTPWVNVDNGDTVEFQSNGTSFTWHFDTLRDETAFDLSKIAPAGSVDHKVTVYVASNPLYRG